MKIHEVKTYLFNELSEDAKKKAISDFAADEEYIWHNDNAKTLEAFENVFPVKVGRYEYGFCRGYINFELTSENDIEELTGMRLRTWLINNFYNDLFKPKYLKHIKGQARYSKIQKSTDCVLTGYCIDNEILSPIYEFLKKPGENTNLYALMQSCLNNWLSACQKDYNYYYSDEAIAETIEANECEFLESGKRF